MFGTTSRCLFVATITGGMLGCAATFREARHTERPEVAAASTALSPLARVAPAAITAANVERVKLHWQALPGGFARGVAVHRGLARVAFSSDSETHLYQLGTGAPAGTFTPSGEVVRSGLFFHGSALFVVCRNGVERYEVAESRKRTPVKVHEAPITAAALSGSRLALAHRDGVIRIHDLNASGVKVAEIQVPGPPIDVKSLTLDAEGQRIAVAWVQGSIWWWRLSEPSVYHRLVRHESESDSLAFAANGLLAEEGRPGFTTLWQLGNKEGEHRQVADLRNGDWIKRLWFTRDSEWLVRGGSDGLELAQIGGPKRLVLDSSGQVEDIGMDETGSLIVSGDRAGRLMVFGVKP